MINFHPNTCAMRVFAFGKSWRHPGRCTLITLPKLPPSSFSRFHQSAVLSSRPHRHFASLHDKVSWLQVYQPSFGLSYCSQFPNEMRISHMDNKTNTVHVIVILSTYLLSLISSSFCCLLLPAMFVESK